MKNRSAIDYEKTVLCVGHKPPLFSFSDAQVLFLCEQDIGVDASWAFGKEYPELMQYGYTLSEYSGLFALYRRMREERITPRRVMLTQYRKFVANHDIGQVSENMKYANTVKGGMTFSQRDIEPLVGNTLVSSPVDLGGSVLDQYSGVHVLRDLMAFVGGSIDCGVISNDEAKDMLDYRIMIPAPSLGCYDGSIFMEIFSLLDRAGMHFIAHGYQPREGYQRRVLGFCLERLNSYLLLKRLGYPKLLRALYGCHVVVSDTSVIKTTV